MLVIINQMVYILMVLFQETWFVIRMSLLAPVGDAFQKHLSAMVLMNVVMEVMKVAVLHILVPHMSFCAIVQNVSPWTGCVMHMLIVLTDRMNLQSTVAMFSHQLWRVPPMSSPVVLVNALIISGSVMVIMTAKMEVMKPIVVSTLDPFIFD